MSGELENAGKRGPGRKEKKVRNASQRIVGLASRRTGAPPTRPWGLVQHGTAAWVREEERASEKWQKKRKIEKAYKVEVALGETVTNLGCFRTALIGPTHTLTMWHRL